MVYCLLTWFPLREGGLVYDIRAVLESVSAPLLNLIRRYVPTFGGLDFSFVIAILALNLLERLLFALIGILW